MNVPNTVETRDHRVRVAAERRERTRRRLLEAAIIVFGQHGVEASVVDEIIAFAGVARGTYYNYFQSNEELLRTVAFEAATEMAQAVAGRFQSPPDGPPRIAAGIRSWMEIAERYPHAGSFFRRAGLYMLDPGLQTRLEAEESVPRWATEGRANLGSPELIFDIMSGCILAGINRVVLDGAPKDYAENMTVRVLVALGFNFEEAHAFAFAPLEPLVLPPDSLIERSVARLKVCNAAS